ncbi:hypothetical protein D3C87_1466580 [compost metagenome]
MVARDNSRRFPSAWRDFDPLSGEQSQKACKVSSSVDRKDAGDVLPRHPSGPVTASNCSIGEREATTDAIHSSSETRDRIVLARGSSDKKVNCIVGPLLEFRHVSKVRNAVRRQLLAWQVAAVVMSEDGRRKRLDLGKEGWRPSKGVPSHGCGLDAAADRSVAHQSSPRFRGEGGASSG